MGYRSEVGITLRKADMDRLFGEAKEVSSERKAFFKDETPEKLLQHAIRLETQTEDGRWSILLFEHVTWYTYSEVNPDVNFVMGFITSCEDMHFLRFGDNYEDSEEKHSGNAPYFLSLYRKIRIDL